PLSALPGHGVCREHNLHGQSIGEARTGFGYVDGWVFHLWGDPEC
ncbi:hypothetical protein KIPB_010347, partial [Kipferlia bialata]